MADGVSGVQGPYRVLARKYRPADFSSLIGQEPMVRTLRNAFAAGRIAQAWMLTGVRGVGKTTTARILARALNYRTAERNEPSIDLSLPGEHCEAIMAGRHVDVVEMDAASHTGIDDIREIIEQVRYAPVSARFKVYIVDEVHMLSTPAFNGLLKTLEEPPPHVKFIFATTEIRKVPITVLSRCQRFDLRRVEAGLLVPHLKGIADKEGIAAEDDALAAIARAAEGSVRDSLSILDQAIAHGAGRVSAEAVRTMLGLADRARVVDLFGRLMGGDVAAALAEFRAQYDAGADPVAVLTDLAEFTHLVTRFRFVPDADSDASLSPEERTRAGEFSRTLSMAVLSRAWQMLLKGIAETQTAARPASAAEMVLIRIAHAAHLPTLDEALASLRDGAPLTAVGGPRSGDGPGPKQTSAPGLQAVGRSGGTQPAPAVEPRFGSSKVADAVANPPAPFADALQGEPVARPRMGAAAAVPAHQAPLPDPPVRPEPQRAAPEAAPETGPAIRTLADILALADANRDMAFKIMVKQTVRPVRIEPGRLEVSFADGAPATLATDISNRLSKWTGRKWFVTVSRETGGRTLAEMEAEKREGALSDARADPAVAEILARFPGAKVIDVRIPDATEEAAAAADPAGTDAPADDPEDEQEP
jgi:DNA polymerase III subunit gamma/tau